MDEQTRDYALYAISTGLAFLLVGVVVLAWCAYKASCVDCAKAELLDGIKQSMTTEV